MRLFLSSLAMFGLASAAMAEHPLTALPPEMVLSSPTPSMSELAVLPQIVHVTRIADDPIAFEIRGIRTVSPSACDYRTPGCEPTVSGAIRIGSGANDGLVDADDRIIEDLPLVDVAEVLQMPGATARQEGESWYIGEMRFEPMTLSRAVDVWYLPYSFLISGNRIEDCLLQRIARLDAAEAPDDATRDLFDAMSVNTAAFRQLRLGQSSADDELTPERYTNFLARHLAVRPDGIPVDGEAMMAVERISSLIDQGGPGVADYLTDNADQILGAARYFARQDAQISEARQDGRDEEQIAKLICDRTPF